MLPWLIFNVITVLNNNIGLGLFLSIKLMRSNGIVKVNGSPVGTAIGIVFTTLSLLGFGAYVEI